MAKNSKKYFDSDFLISRSAREMCGARDELATLASVRAFVQKYNEKIARNDGEKIGAAQFFAMAVLDEIFALVSEIYNAKSDKIERLKKFAETRCDVEALLAGFTDEFPPPKSAAKGNSPLRDLVLHELKFENPAESKFAPLFAWKEKNQSAQAFWRAAKAFFKKEPRFGANGRDFVSFLKEPIEFSPNSLRGQLDYCLANWGEFLNGSLRRKILSAIDLFNEESKPKWNFKMGGELPPMSAYNYEYLQNEYERFTADRDWMPNVVMLAKTVLVWLWQLSKKYERQISRLDEIPDEELDKIASRGFNALWLIGIWRRSEASARIKQICGNPEAAASAYSLDDYEIAEDLGGWDSLQNLRGRLWKRGIRLAADMVPNHTGLDSRWVAERPDLFMQRRDCPFPHYSFGGENLSRRAGIELYLDDHYYSKTDCAVVFKRVDFASGDVRYIYHGNDGTGLPWNDTAQIDFLNPCAREEVIQKILHVARNFPIIRFDAAMVLAKKHIRRLWYPNPGQGGDISTRSEFALSAEEFEKAIPQEFWREVVDRVAAEVPDTLLLAEAFWMLEGYFVRTLGMHRVYNSAFMNMLKKEENQKYRETIKNTLEFDPQVLRRFVNFMNNPDEETAESQFGRGDKYFCVCTMMVTMPGLPMFGHGQLEGFTEKYGMEYRRAYRDETEDKWLLARHEKEIFPLMKMRRLFSGVKNFRLYDFWLEGAVNENVFAYSNRSQDELSLVLCNNSWQSASGWIKSSDKFASKSGDEVEMKTQSLADALGLRCGEKNFVIFQEFRSKKWFVRSSQKIADEGFFAILAGYEAQIFLRFREVCDCEGQNWTALCRELNGAGTDDLEVAMQDLVYGELYDALSEFLTSQFLSDILLEIKKSGEKARLGNILEKNAENADKFYKKCAKFLRPNKFSQKNAKSTEKLYKDFCKKVKNIPLRIKEKSGMAKFLRESNEKVLSATAFLAICEVLKIAGKKSDASALQKLGLTRKAAEAAKIAQKFAKNANKHIRVKWGFDFANEMNKMALLMPQGQKNPKDESLAVLHNIDKSEFAHLLVGKNEFGGTTWFNKEKMQACLRDFEILEYLFSNSSAKRKESKKMATALKVAARAAQYDWNALLRRFQKL